MKTVVQTKARTLMLTAVLFTSGQKVETPQCPPSDEWTNKLWCRYTKIINITQT